MKLGRLIPRLGLVIGGVVVALVVVELLLQGASAVARWRRERVRAGVVVEADEIRIMCVGESTTEGLGTDPWPRQLEEILNRDRPQAPFRVINRGLTSTSSGIIAEQLPRWLEHDRPHAVIAMMGINDRKNVLVYHTPEDRRQPVVGRLRTYRFVRMWWRSLAAERVAEEAPKPLPTPGPDDGIPRIDELRADLRRRPDDAVLLAELADEYRRAENRDGLVATLHALVEVDPQPEWLVELGSLVWYLNDDVELAEELFRRAVAAAPERSQARVELGRLLVLSDPPQAEQVLLEAIVVAPENLLAYRVLVGLWHAERWFGDDKVAFLEAATNQERVGARVAVELARLHREAGRPDPEVRALLHSTWLPSRDPHCFWSLAQFYRRSNDTEAALVALERGLRVFPEVADLWRGLGDTHFDRQEYDDAIAAYLEVVRVEQPHLKEDGAVRREAIAQLLRDRMGQGVGALPDPVMRFLDATGISIDAGTEYTRTSYRNIRSQLEGRDTRLFAMQYPLVDVLELRWMVDFADNVVVVDNRGNFERELQLRPYDEVFTDRFAGRFGHLTPFGNRLIADNAAAAVRQSFADLFPD